MSRYRKVEVSTYGDEKFRKLSPIPPCGQGLWLYLITGPHTTAIPGLFRAGRAGMAEELAWPLDAFENAIRELLSQGMVKADFERRVFWLPNAIKYNSPASPNVVTSWGAGLESIPECELKAEALAGIEAFLETLNPSFLKAFHSIFESSGKPLPKPYQKPSRTAFAKTKANQEQEQEQEQEQANSLALTAGAVPADSPVFITLPLNDKTEYPIHEKRISEWEALYPAIDVRQEIRKYKGWANANPTKRKTRRGILSSMNSWLAKEQDKFKPAGEIYGTAKTNRSANEKQERSRAAIENAARRV